jgi:preprotein translocase subunit SecB
LAFISAEWRRESKHHCRLQCAVLGAPPIQFTQLEANIMADEGNVISNLDLEPRPNGEDTLPTAGIISQYVRDLSVENPNAPESFQWQDAPQMDVQFNIGARAMDGEEVQEVELKIVLTAKAEAGTAYIVDLAYCGLIGMRNLDEASMHAFTFAEAPRILFPFARRVIADAVRDAGFPPLMLEPLDFNGLYMQQLAARQDAEENAPVGNA